MSDNRYSMRFICVFLFALFLSVSASGDTAITVTNGDFSSPGYWTEDWSQVPGWDYYSSGSGGDAPGVNGTSSAYMGQINGISQITTYTISANDRFSITLDYQSTWNDVDIAVEFFAWNGATSTTIEVNSTGDLTQTWSGTETWLNDQSWQMSVSIPSGSAFIGQTLGVRIYQRTAGSWCDINNIRLATALIPVTNGDFSSPGYWTEDWSQVPGWDYYSSGSGGDAPGVNGTSSAYMGQINGISQITTHTIAENEIFEIILDYQSTWNDIDIAVEFFAWNGATSTTIEANSTGDLTQVWSGTETWLNNQSWQMTSAIGAASPYIGQTLGVIIYQRSVGSWCDINNIRLATTEPVADAEISVSPATLNFGNQYAGDGPAAPLEVVVENTGAADLDTTVTIINDAGSAYAIASGSTVFTLSPGTSMTLSVEFDPSTGGRTTATLHFESNDSVTPAYDVMLTGWAAADPMIHVVNPSFAEPGYYTEDWTLVPGWDEYLAGSGAGGSGVQGAAAAWMGVDDGIEQITTHTILAGDQYTLTFDYHSTWQSIDIAIEFIGCDGSSTTTIVTNPVGAFIQSPGASAGPWLYDQSWTMSGAIPAISSVSGQNLGVRIYQRNTDAWCEINNIRITYTNTPPTDPDINVSPLTLDFGEQLIAAGATSPLYVTVENLGVGDLNATATLINDAGSAFAIASGPTTFPLSPGTSTTLGVTFDPSIVDLYTATLRFETDDPDELTVDVSLSGTGAIPAPEAGISPLTLNFGSHNIADGPSAAMNVSLQSVGELDLAATITIINDAGAAFALISSPTLVLAPTNSANLQVVFNPVTLGAHTATLRIVTNDPTQPQVDVALSGNAVGDTTIYISNFSFEWDAAADNITPTGWTWNGLGGRGVADTYDLAYQHEDNFFWQGASSGSPSELSQTTTHTIAAEGVMYRLQVGCRSSWYGSPRAELYYDDRSTTVTFASGYYDSSIDWTEGMTLTVIGVAPAGAVGNNIGIVLTDHQSEGDHWTEWDNVRLEIYTPETSDMTTRSRKWSLYQ
ncbi:choice-of-anchor D domain-containing protein [Candidatus Sumerlaeota bacterium]|nr:choice-of-anchor D domain-containing protein [Candidatus Sumerlaeota bacterium]